MTMAAESLRIGQLQKAHQSKQRCNIRRGKGGLSAGPGEWLKSSACSAFTLIEAIGVLAIVSVLGSVLVPRVFEAIHNAAIVQAAVGLGTVKTAFVQHFAQLGLLAFDGSGDMPATVALDGSDPRASAFDLVLLKEGILDSPFAVKIGFGYIEVVSGLGTTVAPDGINAAYDLDGGGIPNDASGNVVAEAVIVDVTLEDARALNDVIDGPAFGEDNSGNDFRGRVKYAKPSKSNGNGNGNVNGNGNGDGKAWAYGHHRANTVDVHIYLTHK
jgi:type II secretory pathway pseudopilin PulG